MTTLTENKAIQNAKATLSRLGEVSQYAANDGRLWVNYGKVRIYFDRKHIEFFDDGSCDVGSNPYSVSELVTKICKVR